MASLDLSLLCFLAAAGIAAGSLLLMNVCPAGEQVLDRP